jgi:hypothetical protein
MTLAAYEPRVPAHKIDVVASGPARRGRSAFNLASEFRFDTKALVSYAFSRWEPVIYDAMVVAAAIEHADRSHARPRLGWRRDFSVRIPVLEPARWQAAAVLDALTDAASFLTGDDWIFEFVQRTGDTPEPPQNGFQFNITTKAIIAYSDGMNSRAVAGLLSKKLGPELVRVRVGSKAGGRPDPRKPDPFTAVPYNVKASGETSARSRGFKFALISGIAAYLSDAPEIVLPESGQGIFGPALLSSSVQAYPDYRSHPLFTARMTLFLHAILNKKVRFEFPRIWSTKGETLEAYVAQTGSDDWRTTRSCWQSARQKFSRDGELIQCGVCAACMLRRLSVHAAGLSEDERIYACQNLSAETLEGSFQDHFRPRGSSLKEYAIAGAQHLDHMADLTLPAHRSALRRHAALTARALDVSAATVETKLMELFERHAVEWANFLKDKGERSFLRQWTRM